MEAAQKQIGLLQQYEKAPSDVEYIKQGAESKDFWLLWNLKQDPEIKYQQNSDWDSLFADVELAEKNKPNEKPLVYTMNKSKLAPSSEDEELQKLREQKPRLYTYPNASEYATVFDFEDLTERSLICLCVKTKSKIYVWKGIDFEGNSEV
jgi:hypothetical protein